MISLRHWLLAALFAVSVQVMAFMYSTSFQQEDGAQDKGMQGIEIDLGMLGDLGEAQQDVVAEAEPLEVVEAEPEPVETPPEVVEKPIAEVEQLQPVKLAPEPVKEKQQTEVKVAKKPQPKKPVEKKAELMVEPEPVTQPAVVKPAQRVLTSKAPVKHTNQQAQRKQTTGKANSVTSGGSKATTQSYFSKLAATLARHKRYPITSRRRGEEGIVKLFFVVDRQGRVQEFRITESSGYKRLDDAVIDMLKKAQPLPAFPADMEMPQLEINVPIAFQLNSG